MEDEDARIIRYDSQNRPRAGADGSTAFIDLVSEMLREAKGSCAGGGVSLTRLAGRVR